MKNYKALKTFALLVAILASGCTIGPKPIDYGQEACHYCSMTIVDRHFASQLVTDKGKVYSYDATECMLYDVIDRDVESIGMLLVTDYGKPESLIDAKGAVFMISEDYPSPMGANLSAFSDKTQLDSLKFSSSPALYNWQELQNMYAKKPMH